MLIRLLAVLLIGAVGAQDLQPEQPAIDPFRTFAYGAFSLEGQGPAQRCQRGATVYERPYGRDTAPHRRLLNHIAKVSELRMWPRCGVSMELFAWQVGKAPNRTIIRLAGIVLAGGRLRRFSAALEVGGRNRASSA